MAAAALTAGITSCSDFLDEEDKTGDTATTTYTTKSGLDGLVATCYTYARGWYGKEAGLGLSEMGTDLFYYGYDNKQKSLLQYNITSESLGTSNTSDNACLDEYWEMFYQAIDVCNNAYKYVSESSDVIDESLKLQYMAETRFLRALYYFNMVNTWGDIPYNDEPITSVDLAPTRTPEEEVYGKILDDLDEAISLFDECGYRKKTDGRANYWAARALKARVLLYAASWEAGQLGNTVNGKSASTLYTEAQAEAEAVIGATDYASFYDDYSDVFTMTNEAYADNSEALFGVNYSSDLKTTVNCIPYKFNGDSFNSLITRTGYSRGGSAMLLMFVSMWNNGANDFNGSGSGSNRIFVRSTGESSSYITSASTGEQVYVADKYSPYGRGFTRYLPSLRLWQLMEARRATDQRPEATLLTHYDVASPDLYKNATNYPEMQQDTAIYYSPLDGDSEEGQALQAWAKNKYRIQFAYGGDIPVYDSSDPATAKPTESAVAVSSVYGDDRYNSYKIGGWCSYPGIKKFLDDVYDSNYPTHDISSRDAIVMRLPEMYLIKAECQVALGNGSAATTTINQLREVRAIDGMEEANKMSGTCTLDDVLDERAVELCGEQMRWFDLKRTGKLLEYVKKYNAQASGNIQSYHLYRPIPSTQFDAITNESDSEQEGMFWQNPGY